MNRIKVAVTGAAGQVGSIIVRRLQSDENVEAIAICRNPVSAGIIYSVAPGCTIRMGSITEKESAKKIFGDCDIIINCALAMVSGRPKMSRKLNKAIIDNILAVPNLKTLIHMSSVSVYRGCINNKKKPKSTFEHPRPDNDYGKSKLYIEQYAKDKCISKQINYFMLRLGHVLGAKMDRSREILEFAMDKYFTLPFNGELLSNTVHVENLATMIKQIISGSIPSGVYNAVDPNMTWRQVFNWHSNSAGLPEVKGMAVKLSEQMRSFYRSRSVFRDIVRWLGTLPILGLIRYPAVFELAYSLLAVAPQSLTLRLASIYKRLDVRKQISISGHSGGPQVGPIYFSDPMPGKYIKLTANDQYSDSHNKEQEDEFKDWFDKWSNLRWLKEYK